MKPNEHAQILLIRKWQNKHPLEWAKTPLSLTDDERKRVEARKAINQAEGKGEA